MLRILFIVVFIGTAMAMNAQQKLYPVRSNGMWGMMNATGVLVLEAEYNSIGEFNADGHTIAQKGDLLGVIDTLGKLLIPCKYPMIDYVGEGLFSVQREGSWKIINTADKVIFEDISGKITFLEDGFLTYEEISGLGLAHVDSGIILPPNYESFEFLNSSYVIAYDEDFKQTLFQTNGQLILQNGFEKIVLENNWFWGKRSGLWGSYDLNGQQILPTNWTKFEALGTNFYTLVDDKNRNHLYSINLDSIIFSKAKTFESYNDNLIRFVNYEDKKGLIDWTGKIIIQAEYDAIGFFGENTFRVKKGDFMGVMATDGRQIAPFIYHHIGELADNVAIVRKQDKHGIMNTQGEVVIPIIYPKTLSLNSNVARCKDTTGTLRIFIFDENGQLKKNTNFTNLKSLKIGGSYQAGLSNILTGGANDSIENPNQISDSLVWRYNRETRKWGLWDLRIEDYKFTPQYDNITVLKDIGITIVGKGRQDIGGRIKTGRIDLKIHQVFGLFNNLHGLPITKMEFLDIRLSDFDIMGLDVARCIFVGGSHGVLARSGRIMSRGYAYIGEFVEGKARATRKGQLLVDLDNRQKRPLMTATAYFGSFRSRYAFDNDDAASIYTAFTNRGNLYCEKAEWGFIDTLGHVFCGYKYDYVENFSNGRALIKMGGKWGMLDDKAEEIIVPAYDDFDFLPQSDNKLFFIAQHRNLVGAIDSNSKVIVPVEYVKIREYHDDRIAVRDAYRKWGFVDRTGNEIIPTKHHLANDFSEGLSVFYENSKWGAMNTQGEVIIKPQYTRIGDFKEGKAWVYLKKGMKGYINPQNELLFSDKFYQMTDFKDGIARVSVYKKGWGLIDATGNFILKPKKSFTRIEEFNEHGLAKVKIGNRYRLIDQKGEFVGKKSFGLIRDFKEGYAVVREQSAGGKGLGEPNFNFKFIDTLGNVITSEDFGQLEDFTEGRAAFVGEKSKRGYINTQGQVVIEPQYFRAEPFCNNRAVVWESYNKTGVIDTTGTAIIPVVYNRIIDIKDTLALVRRNSWTYYFVYENTKRHSPRNFEEAYAFQHDYAPIKEGGRWGVINRKGLNAIIPKYADIEPFKDGIAKVAINNLLGVVDIKGKIIIHPEYEYVSYAGEGLFRVEKGNKMGYLNMAGEWVWELR